MSIFDILVVAEYAGLKIMPGCKPRRQDISRQSTIIKSPSSISPLLVYGCRFDRLLPPSSKYLEVEFIAFTITQ